MTSKRKLKRENRKLKEKLANPFSPEPMPGDDEIFLCPRQPDPPQRSESDSKPFVIQSAPRAESRIDHFLNNPGLCTPVTRGGKFVR